MWKRKNRSKRKPKKKNKMSKSSRSKLQRLKYIQVIEELEAELVPLKITNERLNGDGVYGLSYTELESLESMLRQGLRSVHDQQGNKKRSFKSSYAQVQYSIRKIAEAEVMGDEWVQKIEEEDFAHQSVLTKGRRALRHKARELRLSSLDSQQKHSHDHEDLVELIEILKSEEERLLLWNQRMIGKELDGMGYVELMHDI